MRDYFSRLYATTPEYRCQMTYMGMSYTAPTPSNVARTQSCRRVSYGFVGCLLLRRLYVHQQFRHAIDVIIAATIILHFRCFHATYAIRLRGHYFAAILIAVITPLLLIFVTMRCAAPYASAAADINHRTTCDRHDDIVFTHDADYIERA